MIPVSVLPFGKIFFAITVFGRFGVMELFIKDCNLYSEGKFKRGSFSFEVKTPLFSNTMSTLVSDQIFIFPGFVDVHTHLREPGFSYKETIKNGTLAAARGGYTKIFSMPNLSPVPDSVPNLKKQLDIIKRDACINVYPYGSITINEDGLELSDMRGLSEYVIAFSDDGKGVQSDLVMLEAMKKAKSLGKIIAAHCEDNTLLYGGYIHDGEYARVNRHKGISSESEWKQIERDLELVRKTGCAYHVCHISAKESVSLIRKAKAEGLDVSCESAPHYLLLTDGDLLDEGRFKMNPPIRSNADREALLEGICDGTIDMIATDHAPHSKEEKSRGLSDSSMGIVGLECAFPLLYTHLVKKNIITLEKLIELMSINPVKRFGLKNDISDGNFCVFDFGKNYEIKSEDFVSIGKATPFENWEVFGECIMTVCNGNIVYQ